jgi:hypothetical protein
MPTFFSAFSFDFPASSQERHPKKKNNILYIYLAKMHLALSERYTRNVEYIQKDPEFFWQNGVSI